ncbi:MAG: hypothetical protein Q4C75_03455 [Bergeyella zoohelcum]|nr:hypothetical protein [Bergeyella zoohelcum]
MKKSVFMAVFAALVVSCKDCPKQEQQQPNATQTTQVAVEEELTLIGKEAVLEYPTMKAEVKYLSENQLYWKTTDNATQATAEGTETLSYKRLNATQFFLNWVEKDGTTVSKVVDLKANKVYAYLTYADAKGRGGRTADFIEGNIVSVK